MAFFKLSIMKLWKHWKPIGQALPALKSKNCWSYCNGCKKKWADIETKFAHMTIKNIDGETATRFLCDQCADELDNDLSKKTTHIIHQP